MSSTELVNVKDQDYLDQDPPLRGQNYVCLSFISPEEVLKRKDMFMLEKYLEDFSNEMKVFFDNMKSRYPDDALLLKSIQERYNHVFNGDELTEDFSFFVSKNSENLEKEYYEKNNFQTTIRGIKVRGTFESLREAEIRAQVLKKMDNKFHVYVAEVGCWCPWSPNPDDIANQEYSETELNTLMKKYKENQQKKDEFFQMRKRELVENAPSKKQESGSIEEVGTTSSSVHQEVEQIEDVDPWMKKKEEDTDFENIGKTSFE